MRIQALSHSTYQHQYHIVWATKYRRKILKPYVKPVVLDSFYNTARLHPEIYFLTINTDEDHVHIQLEIAPSISVASAVGAIKARSSIVLKRKFKFIREMYLDGNVWSIGYFSSTIGINEETIKRYIEHQGRRDYPHSAQVRLGFS